MEYEENIIDVLSKDMAAIISNECNDRINKYGLYSVKSGACKGCKYKYRGDNNLICCMFANIPRDWEL